MPKLMTDDPGAMTNMGAGNFQFSGVRPDKLAGATEYTLVTIVVDISTSVECFADELLKSVQAAVAGCRKSPRRDNLLVRLMTFHTRRFEVHGFKPLGDIDENQYEPLRPDGMTALFDAVYDAVTATRQYADQLVAQDFDVNAGVYIVTDGWDNRSGKNPSDIKDELQAIRQSEALESISTVLIGVNTGDSNVSAALQHFKNQAGLTQYVDVGDVTPQKLAKLAAFVSRSISSQSQALGQGGAAGSLTF